MSQAGSAIDERCATVTSPRLSTYAFDRNNGPREGHWELESGEGSFIDADCPTVLDYVPVRAHHDEPYLGGQLAKKLVKDAALRKLKHVKVQAEGGEHTAIPEIRKQTKPKPFVIPKLPTIAKAQPVSKSKEKLMPVEDVANALKKQASVAAKATSKKASESKTDLKLKKIKKNTAGREEDEEQAPVQSGLRLVGTDGTQILIEMSSGAMDRLRRPLSKVSSKSSSHRDGVEAVYRAESARSAKKGQSSAQEGGMLAEALSVPQIELIKLPDQVTKRSTTARATSRPPDAVCPSAHPSRTGQQTRSAPRGSPESLAHPPQTHQTKPSRGDSLGSPAQLSRSAKSEGDIVSHLWEEAEHVYVATKGKAAKSIELADRPGAKSLSVLSASSDHIIPKLESHRSSEPLHNSHGALSHNKYTSPDVYQRQLAGCPSKSSSSQSHAFLCQPGLSQRSWTLKPRLTMSNVSSPDKQAVEPSQGRSTSPSLNSGFSRQSTMPHGGHTTQTAFPKSHYKHIRGDTSAASYEPFDNFSTQRRRSTTVDGDDLSSLELPPAIIESTESHSTVRFTDELRINAQQALHEYRRTEREPAIYAGVGWVSPYPLSQGSSGSITRASHVTLPALEDEAAQRVSYDEYARLQDIYAERNEHARKEGVYAGIWSDSSSSQVVTEVHRPGGKTSRSDRVKPQHNLHGEEADFQQSSLPSYHRGNGGASPRVQTVLRRNGTASSSSKTQHHATSSSSSISKVQLQMPWDE